MDVRSLMRRSARHFAASEAVVHAGVRLNFAEAWDRGLRLANALLDLGLSPGDRVGVLEENSLGAADAFLGMAAANLVRVPLYPRNSREAHAHMLNHTGCRALLVTPAHLASVTGLEVELPALEHVLVRDDSYESWLASYEPADPDPAVSPEDWYVSATPPAPPGRPKVSPTPTDPGWRPDVTGSTPCRPSNLATDACTWVRSRTGRGISSPRSGSREAPTSWSTASSRKPYSISWSRNGSPMCSWSPTCSAFLPDTRARVVGTGAPSRSSTSLVPRYPTTPPC